MSWQLSNSTSLQIETKISLTVTPSLMLRAWHTKQRLVHNVCAEDPFVPCNLFISSACPDTFSGQGFLPTFPQDEQLLSESPLFLVFHSFFINYPTLTLMTALG